MPLDEKLRDHTSRVLTIYPVEDMNFFTSFYDHLSDSCQDISLLKNVNFVVPLKEK